MAELKQIFIWKVIAVDHELMHHGFLQSCFLPSWFLALWRRLFVSYFPHEHYQEAHSLMKKRTFYIELVSLPDERKLSSGNFS